MRRDRVLGATIDDNGVEHLRVKSGAKIVCVVPSITELLFDLGLGESVVGRTGFCFYPREKVKSVPKIGGTKDFDLQKLAALKATHLIVNIDENPKELVDAARAIVPNTIVTHPITPMDNIKLYELLGSIFCRDQEMKSLSDAFRSAYKFLQDHAESFPIERVAYVIWKQPWMSISNDTYIANMLKLVGWEHIDLQKKDRYPVINLSQLYEKVDRILLSTEPYAFRPKDVEELRAEIGPQGKPKVSLIDAEMTSWYGSRAIGGLRYLYDFTKENLK